MVSTVHIFKGPLKGKKKLDDDEVPNISAFLFNGDSNDNPASLAPNRGKSFQGSIVLGMGFTFDDSKDNGVASPITELQRLTDKDSRNWEVIHPYIGGEEVNTSPTHAYHRYVINFGEHSERKSRKRWPDLMQIVEERVRPARAKLTKNAIGRKRAKYWWHFGSLAKSLYTAVSELDKVLVINCGATPHHAFTFLPGRMVFANTLAVFPFESYAAFCFLQSRPHETWARFFGSSLEDRLRYTPTDCFETFPFPLDWESNSILEAAGREYFEFRADLMMRNNEGMTKTYNRFHNPDERSMEIARLRELHSQMDRAVLDAYGWNDIPTDCEFLLDYEIDEEAWGNKKKPYRYRWPDDVRDEVLARLMALNAERARKERIKGLL